MIYLRPHHLLCTQGYSGKGYSEGFVSHMNEVVDELRNRPGTKITLTFSTDTLCSCCPHKEGEDLCDTQEKVKRFDQKVVDYFGLEEKEYSASSGGGAVTVTVSGKKEVVSVKLAEEVVDPDDIEMLQDLIVAATNEALRKMEEESQAAMAKLTGGLGGLGGGFPF